MPELELPDVTIHYERRGSGRRVLLCNGSGATIATSSPLIDQLAEQFEVLVHDQRCLGRTTISDAQPTMADYAADALALADHEGWGSFAMFGISFGGMVAQEIAVTRPDRIERLALLCTSPGGAGGSSYPLHELADLPPDERSVIGLRNLDTRFTPQWLADHPSDRMIVDAMQIRAQTDRTPEQLRGEAMQLEARRHHDVWDRLPRISCPTLVACGRTDGLAPMANSEAIHSRVAGSRLRVYDGGHVFVYQDRSAFPEIIEFLAT